MDDLVLTEDRGGGVALVTLNDPPRRNAMTSAMGEALRRTVASLAGNADLRCVVLTGAGEAFSGGGDLEMLEEYSTAARELGADKSADMRAFYDLFLSVRDLPVPAIAAVNGHAVGAGFCVALACDVMLVAEEARVGLNFARIGIHPGMGASWLLPRAAGPQRAAELLYTGRLITGREAASYRIALQALPSDEVVTGALALAGEIASSAPLVLRRLKTNLRDVERRTLSEQLDLEAASQAIDYATEDVVEGLAAIRERREPRFRGR